VTQAALSIARLNQHRQRKLNTDSFIGSQL
jgi:hypothetical protein